MSRSIVYELRGEGEPYRFHRLQPSEDFCRFVPALHSATSYLADLRASDSATVPSTVPGMRPGIATLAAIRAASAATTCGLNRPYFSVSVIVECLRS